MTNQTNVVSLNGNGNDIKCPLPKPVNATAFLAEQSMVMERARVSAQVRLSHLRKDGVEDEETQEIMRLVKGVEDYVDGRLKKRTNDHPTAPWLKRITGCVTKKGILAEPICKVIGMIDSFGRYYPEGDRMIPAHVTRRPVIDETGQAWIWVEGIGRLITPSALNKFACMDPGNKRQKSKKNTGKTQLKTVLFRVMALLFMMQKNRYYNHYIGYKAWKTMELQKAGVKIKSTPSGRYCPVCEKEYTLKAGLYCPEGHGKLSKKEEPEGVIWEGHLDMMCRRQTLKLFLCHYWQVYRQALGLSTRAPYSAEHLEGQHPTIIDPWEMCDLPLEVKQSA